MGDERTDEREEEMVLSGDRFDAKRTMREVEEMESVEIERKRIWRPTWPSWR